MTKPGRSNIRKAVNWLSFFEPFFTSLLMALNLSEDETIEEMETDGETLWYNETFFSLADDQYIKGRLMQVVLHCASLHHIRMGERNPQVWNQAADIVTNNELEDYKKSRNRVNADDFIIPKGSAVNPDYKGLHTEEVYRKLNQNKNSGGQGGQGKGNGGGGKSQSGNKPYKGLLRPAKNPQLEKAKWENNVMQAAQMKGDMPANFKKLIDQYLQEQIPYSEVLREFFVSKAKADYTFSKPNRRYISQGLILPSMESNRLGCVGVCIDTSGSIFCDAQELDSFLSEVNGLINQCKPEKCVVVMADAAVQSVDEFRDEPFNLKEVKGGGGTDFRPALEEIAKHDPDVVIYLSDLYGEFPTKAPEFPVVWVVNSDETAPFGTTLHISKTNCGKSI